MKYAADIIKEIEERGPIDTTGCIADKDNAWENFMRGQKPTEMKNESQTSKKAGKETSKRIS